MPRKKSKWKLLTYADLVTFREKQGIRSDKELAEELDVSPGSVAGWKKGVRAPSHRVQCALVAKINAADKNRTHPKVSEELSGLIKRLLMLASEVNDPSALIEASQRLLSVESQG